MTPHAAVELFRGTLITMFWLSLPLLALGFVAGIVVSLIQVVTSMQDASFGAVPRLWAFFFGLLLFLPWMTLKLIAFTTQLFGDFSRYAR
ncbi:MAG TPA: flagellar biosynthetic protein FliQ [Bryobacteraceae bacterium]|jgi:flagellar biosynthetic protein FliQ|nr:flagellar biosynthetic protein FliQ [Bryobacteraceae bacterium]